MRVDVLGSLGICRDAGECEGKKASEKETPGKKVSHKNRSIFSSIYLICL